MKPSNECLLRLTLRKVLREAVGRAPRSARDGPEASPSRRMREAAQWWSLVVFVETGLGVSLPPGACTLPGLSTACARSSTGSDTMVFPC